MHVPSHPEADIELDKAVFFYEKRSEGLGDDFLEDFERTIERVVSSPTRYRKIHGNIRQIRLNRFPFNVVYEIHENDISILAVAHVRRRPFYWSLRHP